MSSVQSELADKETMRMLLATTFNGMSEANVKQAIVEGMMRGFTFKNFLEKDVYAIPYGAKYSLVTSIDYMRKVASMNGLAGKNEPVYEDDASGRPKTCSVTVKKSIEGQLRDFTAKVYFSEYNTGKNQWTTKPRTMIAKVAEMHALRMAFPEQLAKAYTEDEIHHSAPSAVIDYEGLQAKFDACESPKDLMLVYNSLKREERADKEVLRIAGNAKKRIMGVAQEA